MSENIEQERKDYQSRDEDDISLLDMAIVLAKRKRLVIRTSLAVPVLALIVSFVLPDMYKASTTIMPPQEDQSGSMAILGQLSGIGGGLAGATLGLKSPNDLYVGVLKSRTVADSLIGRFELQKLYDKDTLVETRDKLEDRTSVTAGKEGLIRVEFLDKDPERAAAVASAYIEELELLTRNIAVTEASKRRRFFEKQLVETRKLLAAAEAALVEVQKSTGLIKLDDQAKAIFESVSYLRGQISAKEIQIASMRSFATPRNPDLLRAQEELAVMRSQLDKLEREKKLGDGDIFLPTGKVPEAGLEYLRGLREVKYQEAVFEAIGKQLELARVDEGRNSTLIQIVDKAVVPDKKAKPDHVLFTLLGAVLGILAAVFCAFAAELWERVNANPGQGARLLQLREYLRFR